MCFLVLKSRSLNVQEVTHVQFTNGYVHNCITIRSWLLSVAPVNNYLCCASLKNRLSKTRHPNLPIWKLFARNRKFYGLWATYTRAVWQFFCAPCTFGKTPHTPWEVYSYHLTLVLFAQCNSSYRGPAVPLILLTNYFIECLWIILIFPCCNGANIRDIRFLDLSFGGIHTV